MTLRYTLSVLKVFLVFCLVLLVACSAKEQAKPTEIILDADHDGIVDSLDTCPDTQASIAVGKQGCSALQLREQALVTLNSIPLESLTKEDKLLLQAAKEGILGTMNRSFYNSSEHLGSCETLRPFLSAQRKVVVALENLSCIIDDASLVNATESNSTYTVTFKKKKTSKVTITPESTEDALYNFPVIRCSKAAQVLSGNALENILSAHFVMVNDEYKISTCEEKSKDGALRNLKLSIDNHKVNRFLTIVDNLGLSWAYSHECECGDAFKQ